MAVLGCNKTTESLPIASVDTGPEIASPGCDVTVRETIPAAGSMDHYYRDPVVFVMSGPIEEAEVVTDISGE